MKNNLKLALAFFLMGAPVVGLADATSSFSDDKTAGTLQPLSASDRTFPLSWYSSTKGVHKEAADIYPGWSSKDWLKSTYEQRQDVFLRYQFDMESLDGQSNYDEAEANLIRIVASAYPNMASYWTDSVIHDDLRIIQADGLINLSRVYISKFEMGAYQGEKADYYSVDPDDYASDYNALNSMERMKKGLSPVGPDGAPVVLCRLNDDSRASYFEIEQNLAGRLLNAISSNMTLERACLTDGMISSYWKQRFLRINKGIPESVIN
jgi:hypothetical protein